MRSYSCDDGNAEITIEADSAEEAAQEYVDEGDWDDPTRTIWVDVFVTELGDPDAERECITITLKPDEPDCTESDGHLWATPYQLLGGLKESPGVLGHGGGVKGRDVCLLCGLAKDWDNWAQRPDTGEQGLDSVEYVADAFDVEVIATEGDRSAVTIDGICYVIERDGDEVELADVGEWSDPVDGFQVVDGAWEEA
jgi:hypothetical protein